MLTPTGLGMADLAMAPFVIVQSHRSGTPPVPAAIRSPKLIYRPRRIAALPR
jgi:hypothetical protein